MARQDSKKWFEAAAAVAALVVSAISLWVAIGTEDANRKMVSAASWPLIQFIDSDADDQTHSDIIKLSVSNAGVGPAKIESFELFYRGRAMRSHAELMRACCGYVRPASEADRPMTSATSDTVLRAGETRPFLIYAKTSTNAAIYDRLDGVREDGIEYRICYCSVFDECWQSDTRSHSLLKPAPVKACIAPPVSYSD
jgi:hypothetical protein